MFVLFTDGGARGNPGPSAGAAVLKHVDGTSLRLLDSAARYLGSTTNNQAEYQGLLMGLELARKHGAKTLEVRMDSELIVRQMQGVYRVKHPDLKPLFLAAQEALDAFVNVTFIHIPRALNKDADALVNETIDAASSCKA